MNGMLSKPHNCRGIGLVELLVAMMLGLLLTAGAINVFLGTKRTYSLQDSFSHIQESGRYALDLITRELRQTGYLGSSIELTRITGTEPPVTPTNTCPSSGNTWGRMIGLAIAGLDDPTNPNGSYNCINNSDFLRGDILTIRYIDPENTGVVNPSGAPNRLYIRPAPFAGRLFKAAKRNNVQNSINDVLATTHPLVSHAYFVGPAGRQCQGNSIPSLYRTMLGTDGAPTTEEAVIGIEHFQVQYGIDNDSDGIANQYLNADSITTVADWNRVVTVRIWLLARSECPENGHSDNRTYAMGDQNYTPNDGFHRSLYSTTVAVRNFRN